MDNDKKPTEIKRGRGRPPLSPTEKEQRRLENNKRINEHHKASGYTAQKKYRKTNPEKIIELRNNYYTPKVQIHKDYIEIFNDLVAETGLSISALFLNAVEEKYDIALSKKLDE